MRQLPPAELMQAVLADLDALPAKPETRNVETRYPRELFELVDEAARARRLSPPTYMRRAAYAFAAYDMGLNLRDILKADPGVVRDTGRVLMSPPIDAFGDWRIRSLVRWSAR